jgi:hypothetical protein
LVKLASNQNHAPLTQHTKTPPTYPFPAYYIVNEQNLFYRNPPPNIKGTVSGTLQPPMDHGEGAFYASLRPGVNALSHLPKTAAKRGVSWGFPDPRRNRQKKVKN